MWACGCLTACVSVCVVSGCINMYMRVDVSTSREADLSHLLGSVHVSLGIPRREIHSEGAPGGLRCFLALGELSCLL